MAKTYNGIDISSIQGKPDFAQVKASGIKVVILRVHQLYGIDESFEYNYSEAKKHGLKVGVYKYCYAMNVSEAEKEADDVLACLKGKTLDYPVFYDMEGNQSALPKDSITRIVKSFLNKIEDAGFIPAIYCNVNWYMNILDRSALAYDYWLAAYPYEENDDGTMQDRLKPNAGMGWQYSAKGKVPGINKDVDMDIFYKKYSKKDKNNKETEEVEEAKDVYADIIENATAWMEATAADDSHGYDQIYRWGEKGDYDCSAAVIYAYQQAGIPVKSNGATYTGNMYNVFLNCGFRDVTSTINLSTGSGLKRGDVLLNVVHHTAMYCGDGYEVEASINEFGGATGGTPGDQTGSEFLKKPYRNYPWNYVLRLGNGGSTTGSEKFKATGTATSTVDDLYVRATPNGVILGQIKTGDRVEVDGQTSGNWTHVKVAGIGVGYIYTSYLKKDGNTEPVKTTISNKQDKTKRKFVGKVTADVLNVRTWAGVEFPMIKSYPQLLEGNLVDVMNFDQKDSYGDTWYYVRIKNSIFGFVHSDYIKKQ